VLAGSRRPGIRNRRAPNDAEVRHEGVATWPSHRGTTKDWTSSEAHRLRELASQTTPTRVIGLKLDQSEDAVRSKASELGVSLKPTNQSPYNRQK
jgi:hypothetical protein